MEADPNIKGVSFDCSTIGGYKTGQRIEVRQTHVKRTGESVERTKKSFVAHNFCPWCGEPYGLDIDTLVDLVSDYASIDELEKVVSVNEQSVDMSNLKRAHLLRLKQHGFIIQYALA